jgi:hypothetical protein
MDAIWAPLGIGLAVLLIVALGVAWWEHRQRLAEMQRRLEHSEHSRFMLEQQAGEMDARLLALSEALATRPAAKGDQASRAATLSATMQRASTRPAAGDATWQETEPMVLKPAPRPAPPPAPAPPPPDFAPTMPAPADLDLPPR